MKHFSIILIAIIACFFSIVNILIILSDNYKIDKIKNLLMVEVAWGAKNVYFIEKHKTKRTPACENYDIEYEFKALYPERNELGTLCFNNIHNYKIDWFYSDEELKELNNQKQIRKINGVFKFN